MTDADEAAERLRAALREVDEGRKAKLFPADVRALLDERDRRNAATEYGEPGISWAYTTRYPARYGAGYIVHECDDEADARRHLVHATGRTVVTCEYTAWRAADAHEDS